MRRPTAATLAGRDPILAAAIGALPGSDYGADFGGFSPYDPSSNIGGYGSFGAEGPPPPPPHPSEAHHAMTHHPASHPHHPHHMAWRHNFQQYMTRHGTAPYWGGQAHWYGHDFPTGPQEYGAEVWAAEAHETSRRARVLDPNEHSRLKIERYSFSITIADTTNGTTTFPLQAGSVSLGGTLQPDTRIRAQRIVLNSPSVNFVFISTIQVANVNVLVGDVEDAYTYNANGQGVMLDLPTLSPANRATITATYTNLLPPGFTADFPFQLTTTFQGPSTMVGGL